MVFSWCFYVENERYYRKTGGNSHEKIILLRRQISGEKHLEGYCRAEILPSFSGNPGRNADPEKE